MAAARAAWGVSPTKDENTTWPSVWDATSTRSKAGMMTFGDVCTPTSTVSPATGGAPTMGAPAGSAINSSSSSLEDGTPKTGGAMSSSPGVSSTEAGSPKVGGAAKFTSKALPDEGNAEAEGPAASSAVNPTPMAGALSSKEAVGAGEDVGPTRSKPAIAANAAKSASAAPGEEERRAMMQGEAKG